MAKTASARSHSSGPEQKQQSLLESFIKVRADSERLCRSLAIEDYCIQTIPEVSPTKWHLAHVSWFFETFILKPYKPNYREFHQKFAYLFNSYYDTVGSMHPRPKRGDLSRPTVEEIYRYRKHVDENIAELLNKPVEKHLDEISLRMEIGYHHEQQHQELILTDIKHVLGHNPIFPHYDSLPVSSGQSASLDWLTFEGGVYEIGARGNAFAFDNEYPRHPEYLAPFRLASRLVTNREYQNFIDDDSYNRAEFWLADGWKHIKHENWQHPLYWHRTENEWQEFTLGGLQALLPDAPVCHLSFYEADAFARWSGHRLPTEAEWEIAASKQPVCGNLRDAGYLHPVPVSTFENDQTGDLKQLFGDVWEWTQSPYAPYPGFKPLSGSLGEYNGKFMCSQMVLRGGSCVTPDDHIRSSYRNFFYPYDRWQFSGLRLAEDCQ